MKKDPVCGVVFDVREATTVCRYRDRYHYFCSLQCRDTFEQAPRRFAPPRRARRGRPTRRIGGRRKAA